MSLLEFYRFVLVSILCAVCDGDGYDSHTITTRVGVDECVIRFEFSHRKKTRAVFDVVCMKGVICFRNRPQALYRVKRNVFECRIPNRERWCQCQTGFLRFHNILLHVFVIDKNNRNNGKLLK